MESNHRHSALQADALPLSYLGVRKKISKYTIRNDQIHDIEYQFVYLCQIQKHKNAKIKIANESAVC